MKLNLNSRLVAAIAQFRAVSGIRYYLSGVYVEPCPDGGVLIVGTNGHAIAVWRDLSGEIERPAILRIGKALQTACAGKNRRLQIADDRLVVIDSLKKLEVYIQHREGNKPGSWEIEAKYPDFRTVIKDATGVVSKLDVLNPKLFDLVARALFIGGSSNRGIGVSFSQAEPSKGITVLCQTEPEFIAAIMPMRMDYGTFPEWCKPAKIDAPLPEQQPSDAQPT